MEHVDFERENVPVAPKEDGGFIFRLRETSMRALPPGLFDERNYDGWSGDAELAAEIEDWSAPSQP